MVQKDQYLQELYDSGLTLQEIADKVNKTRRYVRARILIAVFTCPKCGHQSKNRANFNRHISSCDGTGTIYDRKIGPGTCSKCGREFNNRCNLRRHERVCDGSGKVDSDRVGPGTCRYCGKEFKNKENLKRHEPECKKLVSIEYQAEYDSGMSIPDIVEKYNVSEKLLSKVIENKRSKSEAAIIKREKSPEKYFFGGTKKQSRGEKVFKQMLIDAGIDKQYNIIMQHNMFGYKLDFSFPDLKLDVEIDGMQHYTKPEVRAKDKIRNMVLIDDGWIVYRIASKDFLARPKVVFGYFLDFLDKFDANNVALHEYNGQIVDGDKKWFEERRDKILNSGIDFSKMGWTKKLGEVLGVYGTTARRWVQRNMPEFYKNHCRTPKVDYKEKQNEI